MKSGLLFASLALALGMGCDSSKPMSSKPVTSKSKTSKPKGSKGKTWYGRPGVTTWNSDHTIKTTYTASGGMGLIRIYEEVVYRPDGSVYSTWLMKPNPLSPKDLLEGVLGGHSRDGYHLDYEINHRPGPTHLREPWFDLKNLEPEIRRSVRNTPGRKINISPSDLVNVGILRVRKKTIPSPSPIVWLTRAKRIEIKDCKFSDFKSLGKELSGLPSMNFFFLKTAKSVMRRPWRV